MNITELLESWKARAEKAEAELARVQRELDHKKMWAGEIAACAKEELEKAHAEIERVKAREAEMREALESGRCAVCELRNNAKREGSGYADIQKRLDAIDHALSSYAGTSYVRKEAVVPLVAAIESAVKNCFFYRGTGAISKAADRMSADPPPLPHECQDCKPLREALAKAKGLAE